MRSQLLELLFLMALGVALRVRFVLGTPLGLRIAAPDFLSLLRLLLGIVRLRNPRAITLVVTESYLLVALIAAVRGRHCCSTSSDIRCRRRPRKLVDVKVDGGLLDLLQREGSVSVMHLPDEGELLRERVQQQIRVGVIEDLLPHVHQAKSRPWWI